MQQISTEILQDKTWLGWKGDPLGIVQEVKILLYEQIVYAKPRIHPEEWHAQSSLEFWDANRSLNLDQMTKPCDSQQQKREPTK